ncbi:MAG: ABC-type branched-chain amino acid transport system permease component [Thermoleophilia bacterium]|nr:ABC-type branched-chain amino acid transport system permease component [Thermoleophilia bacterium]
MAAAASTSPYVPALAGPASASAPKAVPSVRDLLGRWAPLMVLLVALAFPMIEQSLGLGMMNPMLRILTSVMLALGLNIVVGFAGLLDLGYVAFWAIGAYCVAWLASGHFTEVTIHVGSGIMNTIPGIHLSIWLIFPIAAVVTALFGVLLGAPTLRLRGDYLAIVTLGFGEIIPNIFRNGDDIAGHNWTNGTAGISGLDAPNLGGAPTDQMLGMGWGTWGPLNLWPWYYLALGLCLVCYYVSVTMQWSKLGRAWMAIREDETAASAMGIHCVNAKLWAYGIGAALGGMAGVFHGARIGSVFPSSFMFYISISVLCMVIIGGMGNVWGAIAGAFVIEGLNFWLLPSLTAWGQALGLDIDFSSWNMLIFGVLLVVMMLYRPQGFIPSKSRKLTFADGDDGGGGSPPPDAYPAGMQGPDGDAAHGMHAPLEVGHEAHATAAQAGLAPAHEPTTLGAPVHPGPAIAAHQVHHEAPRAAPAQPQPQPQPEPQPHAHAQPTAPAQPTRRFTSRFAQGSNPFDRPLPQRRDIDPEGAPA